MRDFVALLNSIEKALHDDDRQRALLRYWENCDPQDRIWSLWLLLDRRPPKRASSQEVMEWVQTWTAYPDWLISEAREKASDVAEAAALLIGMETPAYSCQLHEWLIFLLDLRSKDPNRSTQVKEAWQEMNGQERYWFNRLLLGSFRFKLDPLVLIRALSVYTERPAYTLWYRLLSDWSPSEMNWSELLLQERKEDQWRAPLGLISPSPWPIEKDLASLEDWRIDWWREGQRVELQWREGEFNIWSAEGRWWNLQFPELSVLKDGFSNSLVLQGYLLAYQEGQFLAPQLLTERLAKKPTKKNRDNCPVLLVLDDLLEYQREDWRNRPLKERWERLEDWCTDQDLPEMVVLAEPLRPHSSKAVETYLKTAQSAGASGLMLRSWAASYGKAFYWPRPDYEVLASLLYLTRDERNPARFSHLSFGIWKGEELITLCKCSYTTTPEEYEELMAFVSENTIERFGPVVSISSELVFRLAFQNLRHSRRRKSGLELIEPRVVAWEKAETTDKVPQLRELMQLIESNKSSQRID